MMRTELPTEINTDQQLQAFLASKPQPSFYLAEDLNRLTDTQLAFIYEHEIGYNPFEDGAKRESVIEILSTDPYQ